MSDPSAFVVSAAESGQTLAAVARARGVATTWSQVRRLIERGKLFVDGACITSDAFRLAAGARIELRAAARVPRPELPGALVYDDSQIVIIDKPAGLSSVPYDEKETETAMDLIRAHWRRRGLPATTTPLHIVHRIDKETSGLLLFAKTKTAERFLQARLRQHDLERSYLCVAHGEVEDRRIESRLIDDRGDGLRGSTRNPALGKRAVTHVQVRERLIGATLCEVRLETGKTHQIRIHLAEDGHPLVGEKVYIRDYVFKGNTPIAASRLLLHAATLGLVHPETGEELRFERTPPEEFLEQVARLRRGSARVNPSPRDPKGARE